MKKLMNLVLVAAVSAFALTGCSNMSASEQRVGAAALGGALGGGVGSNIGGSTGAAIGGAIGAGAGAALENNNR